MKHASLNHVKQENDLHILDILNEMRHLGLESAFICSLMETCQKYEGIRDLMELWFDETIPKERNNIIADLQDSLDDIRNAPEQAEERPNLRISDLDKIKNDIVQFKQYLREKVDRQGGVNELARRSGIPQSSLSRFFCQLPCLVVQLCIKLLKHSIYLSLLLVLSG